jgi:hypothetical protein
VLLLSDGYENRDPRVATALARLPAGLRVFAVALGSAADTALLQEIATSTGGLFLLSPTALDLHKAYNEMRAGITDEGLLLNGVMPAGGNADTSFDVEPGGDRLTVTVSSQGAVAGQLALIAPSGRVVRPDDFGTRMAGGDGYQTLTIARPQPGRWRLWLMRNPATCVVAAFVASPLRISCRLPALLEAGEPVKLQVEAHFDGRRLGPVRPTIRSVSLPPLHFPRELDPNHDMISPALRKLRIKQTPPVSWEGDHIASLPSGFSQVAIEIDGLLPGGASFHRVASRTVDVRSR